jgi:hypothetical protein
MSWFTRPAPVEPSAAERALPRCDACHTSTEPLEPLRVQGLDLLVCVEPTPCRERAQAAGMWKRVPA